MSDKDNNRVMSIYFLREKKKIMTYPYRLLTHVVLIEKRKHFDRTSV